MSTLQCGHDAPPAAHEMRVVCAWCKKDLGSKSCEAAMAGHISHGICPDCKAKTLADECEVSYAPPAGRGGPPQGAQVGDYADALGRIPLKLLPQILGRSRRQVTTICSSATPLPDRLKIVRENRQTVWTRAGWIRNWTMRHSRTAV